MKNYRETDQKDDGGAWLARPREEDKKYFFALKIFLSARNFVRDWPTFFRCSRGRRPRLLQPLLLDA